MGEQLPDYKEQVKELFEGMLPQVEEILKTQAQAALDFLGEAGEELAERGKFVLKKMGEVGVLYASGHIDADSAGVAISNYTSSLQNQAQALENASKVEAYKRARATLNELQAVLLNVLSMGLSIGLQALTGISTRWIANLDLGGDDENA